MALTTPAQKPRGAARINVDGEPSPARSGTLFSSTGAKLMIMLSLLLHLPWRSMGRSTPTSLVGVRPPGRRVAIASSRPSHHWKQATLVDDELASPPVDVVLEESRAPHTQAECV